MSMQKIEPMQDLEDAEQVVLCATNPAFSSPQPVEQVAAAALTLQRELRAARQELQWARATLLRQTGQETVPGGMLRLGRSPGGARNYLNDLPVHAGDELYLLTRAGWLPGRYEYRHGEDSGLDAFLYFGLPGARGADAVPIKLPPGARLAWPMDVEGRR